MIKEFRNVINTFHMKMIAFLFLGWIIMLIINYLLNSNNIYTGSRITFPISVVYINNFTIWGIISSFTFLLFSLYSIYNYKNLTPFNLFFSYFCIIILGNLSQGTIHQTFLRSFVDTDFQYYHDAIQIKNGFEFISSYIDIQDNLTMHSKTHPPFTVWLHYIFLKITNNSPLGLSLLMSIIGLLPILPLFQILKTIKIPIKKINILVLIFALIPAVNIYSIVSIDAHFLFYTLLFLYGLIKIHYSKNFNICGIILALLGFTLANLISFSGTFLAAFAFFYCVHQIIYEKRYIPFKNFVIVGLSFIIILFIINFSLHYNHIEAFLNASKSENPNGFRGLHQPLVYLFTRIENISEILLFLSFGFWSYLFYPKKLNINKNSISFILPMIAFGTLILMFITGAYGTGETARACLYIYPFFLLLLINIQDEQVLKNIAYLALFQTFFMQMLGDYFW